MKGTVGKWRFRERQSKGISRRAYWDNGFHMTAANRPLLRPSDFEGRRIPISGSKIADRHRRDAADLRLGEKPGRSGSSRPARQGTRHQDELMAGCGIA